MIRRRDFVTLLGGAAAAWPLQTRAQQRERMRRIGLLLPAAADDREFQVWVGALLQSAPVSGRQLYLVVPTLQIKTLFDHKSGAGISPPEIISEPAISFGRPRLTP